MAKTDVAVSKGRLERMPRPFARLGDIDRLFDDFFGRRFPRAFGWGGPLADAEEFTPDVDVIDREDEVLVRVAVPGYKKEEIEISVSGNVLTLKGETRAEEKDEKGDYFRKEIVRASFTRSLALPAEVDDEKAKASMKDGLLELTLPKLEKAKRRTISIS